MPGEDAARCDEGLVLGYGVAFASQPAGQHADEFAGAEFGEARFEGAGGVRGEDRLLGAGDNGAGIHLADELHDAYASDRVACADCCGNGRCPAPARQQGRMDVEAAPSRDIENDLREYSPIGGDDEQVGASFAEPSVD